jgi:hypothetical protein
VYGGSVRQQKMMHKNCHQRVLPQVLKFGFGARPGVILAAAQRHKTAQFATIEPLTGGGFGKKKVAVNCDDVGRYGRELPRMGTKCHSLP